MFAIVSECCPVGCANDVFLVRSKKDGRIYSYCWACGAMWSHPLAARWEGGRDEEFIDPRTHLPDAFDLPSDDQIAASGFSEFVIRNSDCEYCAKYFESELHGHV
jgi:hypothetical protein